MRETSLRKMRSRRLRAFSLIELLIVILILGIIVAVAFPAYLASIRDAKLKTANANARMIASAYQALYVRGRGTSYATISDEDAARELNGWPRNPCSDSVGLAGYLIEKRTAGMSITPRNDGNCETPITATLGTP